MRRLVGTFFRPLSRLAGDRALPKTATVRSSDTAEREPGAVTLHPAGPAEVRERGPAAGDPDRHWVFERGRQADIPAPKVTVSA